MSEKIETVIVRMPHGDVITNKADWTPDLGSMVDPETGELIVQPPTLDGTVCPHCGGVLVTPPAPAVDAVTPPAPAVDAVTPPAPAPALMVAKIGKRWHIVDAAGVAVVGEKFAPDGYTSEADAWTAIMGA